MLPAVTRRAPRRTLCPYTTLFRSRAAAAGRTATAARAGAAARAGGSSVGIAAATAAAREREREAAREECNHQQISNRLDRKSTRLNSNHLGISYAVFCLKKKTRAD